MFGRWAASRKTLEVLLERMRRFEDKPLFDFVAKKPGPKPKTAKKAKAASKRKWFPETAEQFIVGLVKGKVATTAEINQAWKDSGRGASADTTLSKMVKDGKIKRENIEGRKGSRYTKA
jgi:hypothetical protein